MTMILNFDEDFAPVYGSYILLPQHCVFYRGYDTRFPIVSGWPSHYSTETIASSYGSSQHRTLGVFTNPKQPLRIVDYRYLKVLLADLFQNRPDNDQQTVDPIIRTSVGYGMCDLVDQLHIGTAMFKGSPGVAALKQYYEQKIKTKSYIQKPLDINPVSTCGFRIAETDNDTYILQFLKECMGHIFDGFISPRQKSPYHVEKNGSMSPELVLFSPEKVGIVQIQGALALTIPTVTMNNILKYQSTAIHIEYKKLKATHRRKAHTSGGCENNIGATDDVFQDAYINKNKEAVDLLKDATKAAKKWKKQFTFLDHNARHPQSVVHSWQGSLDAGRAT